MDNNEEILEVKPNIQHINEIIAEMSARSRDFDNNFKYRKAATGSFYELLEEDVFSKISSPQARKDYRNLCVPTSHIKQYVNRLAQLYSYYPKRDLIDCSPEEINAIQYTYKTVNIDSMMQTANRYFVETGSVLVQRIFQRNRKGKVEQKLVPWHNSQYFLWSSDKRQKLKYDHVILFLGEETVNFNTSQDPRYRVEKVYEIWTNEMVVKTSQSGGILYAKENKEGSLPFIHITSQPDVLFPTSNFDSLKAFLQAQFSITSGNVNVLYQASPLIWGVNLKFPVDENGNPVISRNANDFLNLQSTGDGNATLNVLSTAMNLESLSQFSFNILKNELLSMGLKEHTGTATSHQSGVSALIQNLDVAEVINVHANIFAYAEEELFQILVDGHNYILKNLTASIPYKMPMVEISEMCEMIVDFKQTSSAAAALNKNSQDESEDDTVITEDGDNEKKETEETNEETDSNDERKDTDSASE